MYLAKSPKIEAWAAFAVSSSSMLSFLWNMVPFVGCIRFIWAGSTTLKRREHVGPLAVG
jgi:hypothetical protein